jgi:tetratricopeptide (TPR) repeat protein
MSVPFKVQGLADFKAGRFREAIAALTAHLAATPDDYETATAIALACHRLGQAAEAHARFEGLLRQYPNSASIRYHYGMMLEREGKENEACVWYRAALRIRPGFTSVRKRLDALTHPPTELLSHTELRSPTDVPDPSSEPTAIMIAAPAPPVEDQPPTQPEVQVDDWAAPVVDATTETELAPVLEFELLLPESAIEPIPLPESAAEPLPLAAVAAEIVHDAILLDDASSSSDGAASEQPANAGESESKSFVRKKDAP